MTCFVRLASLYNYEPRKNDEPKKGNKPAKKRKPRKPRVGRLAVGKTKLHEDYVLRDPKDPLIPGTDVPRLNLVYLGPKTPVTTDDEVDRVIAGLQQWAARQAEAQVESRNPSKATTVAISPAG
jgi:hypothetical protein